jgi:hypothetical protein
MYNIYITRLAFNHWLPNGGHVLWRAADEMPMDESQYHLGSMCLHVAGLDDHRPAKFAAHVCMWLG